VSAAQLVVQNGLGYDTFMHNIEAAAPSTARKVIDVQRLLGLPNNTPNPHLWYAPRTLPVVARAIAKALAALAPAHARYFAANLARFDASLRPWARAIARVRSRFRNDPVATTEPVADYLLQAAGLDNRTPFSFQADVMNGVDPSPQNLSLEQNLFNRHLVRAFLYNRQVTDSLTRTMVALARSDGIPVVGVYETMPTPGYDYQSWMLAVTTAIQRALAGGP
jgi:zinc/manganese transport system substrate-binding protein